MPEIHVINGEPRECSDAITARGLTQEWLADPDATDAKAAGILADEAAARAVSPSLLTPAELSSETTLPRPFSAPDDQE